MRSLQRIGDAVNTSRLSRSYRPFSLLWRGAFSPAIAALKGPRHDMDLPRASVLSLVVLAALALTMERGEAHKPITSKYTYNDDVFPIVRDRCGRCHIAGGVAPMSLMTYKDAFPWAESIR